MKEEEQYIFSCFGVRECGQCNVVIVLRFTLMSTIA